MTRPTRRRARRRRRIGARPQRLLVAVEGIDGTGKSTLVKGLAERLRARGLRVATWKEPSDSLLAAWARRLAGSRPYLAGLFFSLDRFAREEEREALRQRADVLLSDRSHYSTLAYQVSALRGDRRRELESLQRLFVRAPDLVIWLALDPEEALRRVQRRGTRRSQLERRRVLSRVAKAYARGARAEPRRFVRLDARRDPPEVLAEAERRVLEKLPPRSAARG